MPLRLDQLAAGRAPAFEATLKQGDIRVAEAPQHRQRPCDEALAVIIDYDRRVEARHQLQDKQLEAAERTGDREQRVAPEIRTFLAQIQQGDFFTVAQATTHLRRVDPPAYSATGLSDRSQRLSTAALT